mgnify:CR=1 FL=1
MVKENSGLVKENKYLVNRVSTNELSIHELRKEMTDLQTIKRAQHQREQKGEQIF